MQKETFNKSLASVTIAWDCRSLQCVCSFIPPGSPFIIQGPGEWPRQAHVPVAGHSLRLGQFALLVKRDASLARPAPSEEAASDSSDARCREVGAGANGKRRKPWPCRESDGWYPPSCSIPDFSKGTLHLCSDKLCRWNCLGLQGALLMPVLDRPLHMTSLTVGRKFSRATCARAVCCRAEGFRVGSATGVNTRDKNAATCVKYKLNHPTLTETNVYMDETGKTNFVFYPLCLDNHIHYNSASHVLQALMLWQV